MLDVPKLDFLAVAAAGVVLLVDLALLDYLLAEALV
jgi:hypothetical protein